GHWTFGAHVYIRQLILNYLIAKYNKPQLSCLIKVFPINGAGLSINGRYKIITGITVFTMLKAALGLFPDIIGPSYFLSRLPWVFSKAYDLNNSCRDQNMNKLNLRLPHINSRIQ
ncbi:hypothetical protein B296_00030092, partial [Ensete ventricosum]